VPRGRRWFYAALAATTLVLVVLVANSPCGATVGFNSGMPWYEYLHTQGWAIAHYLRLALVPNALSLDYDFRAIAHWRGIPGLLLLGALAVATILAWARASRWGWRGFLGAWFFLILAPSSSVVPILTELVAERRMYLPLAAVVMVFVVAVVAVVMLDAHREDLAENYLGRAADLGPTDADALTELGNVKSNLGKKAEAIALFGRALRLDPNDVAARAGLARLR
jgi:tetratricopeptide (TPR) repeat protein